MNLRHISRTRQAGLGALTLLALAACGGGGSSDGTSGTTTPTPTPTAVTITGTAAKGAAIPGGAVSVKCASGTGTATTGADGSYTVTVSNGSLPCAVEVTAADGTVLHSLAQGSGSGSVTVNVTPLSELLVARLAGASPSAFFAAFATQNNLVTASAVAAAQTAVVTALNGVTSLSGVNVLTDTLVVGNAFDLQLDALQAALATANTTLPQLTAAVVATATVPATSGALAPVAALVQPATASCAWLHSGKYRIVNPNESGAFATRLLNIDAPTRTITTLDDNVATTGTDNGRCAYTSPNGARVFVASSGAAINHYTDGQGVKRIAVMIPEQTLTVADLAGTWTGIGFNYDTSNTALESNSGNVTLDAAGNLSIAECGNGLTACKASVADGQLSVNANGGFNYTAISPTNAPTRMFAFRAANGAMMLIATFATTGEFFVATKQNPLVLPAVGDKSSFWDMSVNSGGVASAYTDTETTVLTVDTSTQSYTRKRTSDGRVDGFANNTPRTGLRYRAAGSSVLNDGSTVTINPIVVMPLQNLGLSVYSHDTTNVAAGFFGVSVTRPN